MRGVLKPQVDFWWDARRPFKPLPREQAFAMLEWGLNWCVASHCHRYLVIHAASLARGGRALIMPAPPGSGKSTLCAALMLRGWRLLSDELTLVDTASGLLYPLARPVNLKNASIDIIQQHFPQAQFGPVVPDTHKGRISHLKPDAKSIEKMQDPARPAWVVYPRYQAGVGCDLAPVGPAQSFMLLAQNAFNYTLLGQNGFLTAASLISQTRSLSLVFSELSGAIDEIEALR
jgi:HprK-related kinase A